MFRSPDEDLIYAVKVKPIGVRYSDLSPLPILVKRRREDVFVQANAELGVVKRGAPTLDLRSWDYGKIIEVSKGQESSGDLDRHGLAFAKEPLASISPAKALIV